MGITVYYPLNDCFFYMLTDMNGGTTNLKTSRFAAPQLFVEEQASENTYVENIVGKNYYCF